MYNESNERRCVIEYNREYTQAGFAAFAITPDDMNYEVLAKKARYFKQDEKGVATMCKIMEDMRNEAAKKTTKDNARRLLKLGKIRNDEISECFPDLTEDDVKELEAEAMQLA